MGEKGSSNFEEKKFEKMLKILPIWLKMVYKLT